MGIRGLYIGARVLVAVVGGYAVSAILVATLSVALPVCVGMARSDAVVLSSMLGFVLYSVMLIWGFAQRSLLILSATWSMLAGAGFGIIWLLQGQIGAGG